MAFRRAVGYRPM
uniref:Uncharacterized protein n=1 Tax=Arundo donax TaxID=35708 RepID=A0A0A9BN71_ARUDO